MALGTAAGQGIILLATPILARIYSPKEFGSLAILLTVSNIATALACFRYDLSLPNADEGEESSLFFVAIFASALCSFVVMFALGVSGIFSSVDWPSPFDNIFIIGLCVFFVGTQQAVIGLMTHDRNYGGVGAVRFCQGGVFAALATFPTIGLLFAHVFSFLISVPFVLRRLFCFRISIRQLVQSAYNRRDFPLNSLPGAVLDVLGYSTCVWIIVYFFGTPEAGQYAQIQRIVGAPLMLLGMSVGQVLLRSSVDSISSPENLYRLFRFVGFFALLLGLLVVAVIAIVGEPLLHLFLGSQWRVDTAFIVPITLAVTVRACVSPLSMLLVSLRRFDLALRWQFTYFLSSVSVFTFAATSLNFGNFVIVYAIHEIILYCLYLMLIAKAIRNVKCAVSSV